MLEGAKRRIRLMLEGAKRRIRLMLEGAKFLVLVRRLFSILNSCSPTNTNLRHFIISFGIMASVLLTTSLVFYWLYEDYNFFLRKLECRFVLYGVREFVFRIFGWEMPIYLLSLVGSLVGASLHMMDPAGGPPAANPVADQPVPAAQQPANVPAQEVEIQAIRDTLELRISEAIRSETEKLLGWNISNIPGQTDLYRRTARLIMTELELTTENNMETLREWEERIRVDGENNNNKTLKPLIMDYLPK